MSLNCYLYLDGLRNVRSVPGKDHAIHVLSWQWGGANTINLTQTGTGAGASRAHAQSFTISKRVDIASPWLAQRLFKGVQIPKGTMRVQIGEDKTAVDLFVLKLDGVFIEDIHLSGASGEASIQENISFVMERFEIETNDTDQHSRNFGWDLVRNAVWTAP